MTTRKQSGSGQKLTPMEALREACARNAPLEIVEQGTEGLVPFARGRMFEIKDGAIIIEQLQLIGKTVRFARQTRVLAYFRYDKDLYEFRTAVRSKEQPVQINKTTIVPAISLEMPKQIEKGQRRNVFRIPLAALETPISVDVWIAEGDATSDPYGDARIDIEGEPRWTATMVDASDVGLGINIENARLSDFKLFQSGVVRFEIPGDDEGAIEFDVEIRQIRSVREGLVRVGFLIIETGDRIGHIAKVRRFWAFLTEWQRRFVRATDAA